MCKPNKPSPPQQPLVMVLTMAGGSNLRQTEQSVGPCCQRPEVMFWGGLSKDSEFWHEKVTEYLELDERAGAAQTEQ